MSNSNNYKSWTIEEIIKLHKSNQYKQKDIWETTVNTIWDSQIGYSDEEVFVSVLFDIQKWRLLDELYKMIINTNMPRMFLYNTVTINQNENEKILLVISLYYKGRYFVPMNIIISRESISACIIKSPRIIMMQILFIVYRRHEACDYLDENWNITFNDVNKDMTFHSQTDLSRLIANIKQKFELKIPLIYIRNCISL